MSDKIATYTFLPWIKQGLANKINEPVGDAIRATVDVNLVLSADRVEGGTEDLEINETIEVYGPGDVIGIDQKNIIKTEPLNKSSNFESNYLPYIEFYDLDLPWRYSPDPPSNSRIIPWIMLIVLEDSEFKDNKNIQGQPLPSINVNDFENSPPLGQLWAWAHVHVNRALGDAAQVNGTNINEVLDNLENAMDRNPDIGYSRIVSPRRLEAKTTYHGFLVPVFESGRLAGLGEDPNNAPDAMHSAWAEYPDRAFNTTMPYYHRWTFRTGIEGDFEYLVNLLKPKPMDSRVGNRDMDVQNPGANISGISRRIEDVHLEGVLRLGGALKNIDANLRPSEIEIARRFEEWDFPYPHPFQEDLAAFINLNDDYDQMNAAQAHTGLDENLSFADSLSEDEDPIITPPLYGRWHALTNRLLNEFDGDENPNRTNWIHELNLDPRWRVVAGLGTKVVQKNQEDYMEAAWLQVGDVLEANKRIRLAQLAKTAARSWYSNQLQPLRAKTEERFMTLAAPLTVRVISQGLTVRHRFDTSTVALSPLSLNMRKVTSPRGRVMKRLSFDANVRPDNFLQRINAEEVNVAPPKKVPAGVGTIEQLADELVPSTIPDFLVNWLRKHRWIKWIPLGLAVILLILSLLISAVGFAFTIPAALLLLGLFLLLLRWENTVAGIDNIRGDNLRPEAVDDFPKIPNFRITDFDEPFTPATGSTDSEEGIRYKAALREKYAIFQASSTAGLEFIPQPIDLQLVATDTFKAIDPGISIPKFTFAAVSIPARLILQIGEFFKEAMAYPEFDIPMYEPLVKLSKEYFLPNINYVEPNSISLLETNQRFIESYMVGLNHEFARELLWREYPTDQRGSYFQQFWDVTPFLSDGINDGEEEKEALRDIPPIHLWSRFSNLGDHDHRERLGEDQEDLALVIKGDVLERYPNAVIYAHRARWQETSDEDPTPSTRKERSLIELDVDLEDNPPRDTIKTPLYRAKVLPDITFLGFDLTAEDALGLTEGQPNDLEDRAGWFFVIKERPGELRFGLDIGETPSNQIEVWNDLGWDNIAEDQAFIRVNNSTPTIDLTNNDLNVGENDYQEKIEQRNEDVHIQWSQDMNAADMAYILYQVPVLVAIHAAKMIPR